jgi:hypothetical protein
MNEKAKPPPKPLRRAQSTPQFGGDYARPPNRVAAALGPVATVSPIAAKGKGVLPQIPCGKLR